MILSYPILSRIEFSHTDLGLVTFDIGYSYDLLKLLESSKELFDSSLPLSTKLSHESYLLLIAIDLEI